jgi:SAM-dependent methyltransferase
LHSKELDRDIANIVRYLQGRLHGRKISSILDLGCGTGRLLSELASAFGSEAIGFDLSEEMIKEAKRSYANAEYFVSDMSNFQLERQFDLVICTNDAINYLTPFKRKHFFYCVASHMLNNAMCYIDFDTATDIIQCWDGQLNIDEGNGWRLKRSNRFDQAACVGIETHEWSLLSDENPSQYIEEHMLYPILPNDLLANANEEGLSLVEWVEPSEKTVTTLPLNDYLRLGILLCRGNLNA